MTRKVTAGLFDIQVNGFSGIDFNDACAISGEALDHALGAMLATGVTACLPTIITGTRDEMDARLRALDRAARASRLGAAMIPGYHLEGPFLNPMDGYAGCHPADSMAQPDPEWVSCFERALSRPILMVTYAPERDDNERFAKSLHAQGKILSVGHSAADIETVARAAHAGACMCTHLGNGVPQLLPKFNNTIQAQLGCDDLCASFIADGLHIPPGALRSMLRSKGLARSILVTDAVSAAGATRPGAYRFAGSVVELGRDGSVRIPGSNYLAGSSLTLDRAVRNVVAWTDACFEEAIAMATENPQRILASAFGRHGIAAQPGEVEWNDKLQVVAARVGDHKYRPTFDPSL
ncbi:N-acetylglucosamine-6-phosphate deacetylase [Verminephrobacter eiseniae]|uniref:N-acetylglucosamine 6-phosphate deacetylase n=1 Tax=Verminephrobacter eiseniae (strain EF01-2) TaxID=391735 RepID=A1WHQ2_VEREI|nr:amidohydrolase family protein [Verminephrobacter eiseniae]ABM57159.1 N-acetylglucosamine 6-phosphate deacetylase [Verminephrobacter eiseniae EF01-2]